MIQFRQGLTYMTNSVDDVRQLAGSGTLQSPTVTNRVRFSTHRPIEFLCTATMNRLTIYEINKCQINSPEISQAGAKSGLQLRS